MGRSKKNRIVEKPPIFEAFKPIKIKKKFLKKIELNLDEYEAIRLVSYENLTHKQASEKMLISRSTLTRVIESAQKKIAIFLIEGAYLEISGGSIHFSKNLLKCSECNNIFDGELTGENICPKCNSNKVINLASHYGHGKCCRKNGKKNEK